MENLDDAAMVSYSNDTVLISVMVRYWEVHVHKNGSPQVQASEDSAGRKVYSTMNLASY